MRYKKCFTILLVLFFLATVTLSLTFIAENFHHECTGDDCIICQIMETAEEIVGGGKDTANTAADAVLNQSFTDVGVIVIESDNAVVSTPVSLCDLLTI